MAFNEASAAARAFDMAVLRLRGTTASINFPVEDYEPPGGPPSDDTRP